jgi:elongation factor Ts
MAEITAEAVKALREITDLPMMECKKALTEAGGDQEKAIALLRERVKGLALKFKDRATSEGRVHTMKSADGKLGAMIELQCETAPVAKNEDFLRVAEQMCKQLLVGPGATTPEELLAQTAPDFPGRKLGEMLDEVFNKIRERMVLARVLRVEGPVGAYTHHDGKLGVLFQAKGTPKDDEVLRGVAMQIAALKPKACLPSEIDPAVVAAEKAKQMADAKASGKPENVLEKIVSGKMRTFFANEGVLVEQPYVKDDSKTVEKALAEVGVTAVAYTRWFLGQS